MLFTNELSIKGVVHQKCMWLSFLTRKIASNIRYAGEQEVLIADGSVLLKESSNSSGYEEWPQWKACGCQKEMTYEDSRFM